MHIWTCLLSELHRKSLPKMRQTFSCLNYSTQTIWDRIDTVLKNSMRAYRMYQDPPTISKSSPRRNLRISIFILPFKDTLRCQWHGLAGNLSNHLNHRHIFKIFLNASLRPTLISKTVSAGIDSLSSDTRKEVDLYNFKMSLIQRQNRHFLESHYDIENQILKLYKLTFFWYLNSKNRSQHQQSTYQCRSQTSIQKNFENMDGGLDDRKDFPLIHATDSEAYL